MSSKGSFMRFSGFRVFKEGLTGNKGWAPHWRDPEPRPEYDILIIGGGGHGLATAYYLAAEHGLTNVAVLEKGYLGGGNVGRNTTIVRANYAMPGNSEFYSHSLKLWEGLEDALNYNVMHSQRGVINLFHSDGQRDYAARRGNAMINQGDDAVLLDRDGVAFDVLGYGAAGANNGAVANLDRRDEGGVRSYKRTDANIRVGFQEAVIVASDRAGTDIRRRTDPSVAHIT